MNRKPHIFQWHKAEHSELLFQGQGENRWTYFIGCIGVLLFGMEHKASILTQFYPHYTQRGEVCFIG